MHRKGSDAEIPFLLAATRTRATLRDCLDLTTGQAESGARLQKGVGVLDCTIALGQKCIFAILTVQTAGRNAVPPYRSRGAHLLAQNKACCDESACV